MLPIQQRHQKANGKAISLSAIRALDKDVEQRLFAYLIASRIDANGCCGANGIAQMDEIALAAKIDMNAGWQPSVGFFESVSMSTLLKILREQCGGQRCGQLRQHEETRQSCVAD